MESLRVLVTGGSRGIGRAIALRFAREGARVAVAARSSGQLDAVVKEIEAAGGHGRAQQMNVGDHGSVEAAVWRAVEFTGGAIDVLVNNAGAFSVQPFAKLELATWRRHIEVNLDGPFYVTSEALEPLLAGHRPHIFNMSSIAGRRAYPGGVAYSTTKYGLRGFSDALREDLRAQGVRVSTIYPGPTDTGIFDGIPGDWDRTKMNKPEDVAEVVWKAYQAPDGTNVDDLDVPPRA
ncbi:MAG TPA: SDR family oxidoreductase [Planctomycetota bacterium]|jgi:NAD(P)-dependent dehydrogenase (short-subunit alcohol dehydrogenase family)|nr:SDR family oxidoreductase [Planctomycetota bacterium]